MTDFASLLEAAREGDGRAASELLPLVYDELRRLAAAQMKSEAIDHTLTATALVHEACIRLIGRDAYESRSHFVRVAAQAMRRILIDHARTRAAQKRGGGRGWADEKLTLHAGSVHPRFVAPAIASNACFRRD
jgi:RNA polymerase sigma factor (TIGR02999 family)